MHARTPAFAAALVAAPLVAGCDTPPQETAAAPAVEAAPAPPPEDPRARFLANLSEQLVMPRHGEDRAESVEDVDHHLAVEVGGEGGVPPATLDVWVFDAEKRAPRSAAETALILHGLGDAKDSMAGLARLLAGRGLRVVAVDLRGHGRSTGEHIGYGAFEVADLQKVLDRLALEGLGPGREVAVYGTSYGAHVALQLAAVDRRVDRVVAVGAYRSFRSSVPHFVALRYPEHADLPDAEIQAAVDRAAERAGFDPEDASAEALMPRGDARVLLVHGAADQVVPLQAARDLAARCPERCRVLPLPGKDHLESMRGPELRAAIFAWLEGRWDDVAEDG